MALELEFAGDIVVATVTDEVLDRPQVEAFQEACQNEVAKNAALGLLIDLGRVQDVTPNGYFLFVRLFTLRYRFGRYRLAVCSASPAVGDKFRQLDSKYFEGYIPIFTGRDEALVAMAAPPFILEDDPALPIWKRKKPGWKWD
jgi:hypothetical protein